MLFSDGVSLATIFELFESAKDALFISEYSVGQTTMEQIFNGFASQGADTASQQQAAGQAAA